jgi:uncharacterized protein YndB with AHSA1/START domain
VRRFFMRGRSILPGVVAGALSVGAATLSAEVVDVADNGFNVRHTIAVAAEPAKAFQALLDVGKWWDPAHTYSQDAANLSLDAKPQGCFCERLPGGKGAVLHMTVVNIVTGKMLRLEGGLGPLQALGVAGSLTWTFKPADNGAAVELRYSVGGYNPGGFKALAPAVDSVLRTQLERFKRYADTGKP